MNVEFLFHGVPAAFSEWGTGADSTDKRFYSNVSSIKEDIRFSIEISRIENKYCAYYTYLRYPNVFDHTGRSGSYFGLTIRFDDEYCKDVEAIYHLCDNIFQQQVCGQIIERKGNSFKYLISSFEENAGLLQQIAQQAASRIVSGNLAYGAIAPTLLSPAGQPAQAMFFNLMEVGSAYFWQSLKNASSVYFSPSYPLRDAQILSLSKQIDPEKAKNQQLNAANAKLTSERDELQKQVSRYHQDVVKLQQNNAQLESQIIEQRKQIDKLQNEQEYGKSKKKIEQSIAQISAPLMELTASIRTLLPDDGLKGGVERTSKRVSSALSKIWKWTKNIFAVVAFALLIGLYFTIYKEQDSMSQIETKIDNILSILENIDKPNPPTPPRQDTEADSPAPPIEKMADKLRIDISEVGTDPNKSIKALIVGKTYNISVKKLPHYNGDIPTGGQLKIKIGDEERTLPEEYMVSESDKNPAVITLYLNGKKTDLSRTIPLSES